MKDLNTLTDRLTTVSDTQLDDLYELNIGYRAIEDGATREEVIDILANWEVETGEVFIWG